MLDRVRPCNECGEPKAESDFERATIRICKSCRHARRMRNRILERQRDPAIFRDKALKQAQAARDRSEREKWAPFMWLLHNHPLLLFRAMLPTPKAKRPGPAMVVCAQCKTNFRKSRNTLCCCRDCKLKLTRLRLATTCLNCGKPFNARRPYRVGKTCSPTCGYELLKKAYDANPPDPAKRTKQQLRRSMPLFIRHGRGIIRPIVGCSHTVFLQWLESQFSPGMTWENYGEWQVDHVMPCSAYELHQAAEVRRCFHYSNLQPLWAKENRAKGGINGGKPRLAVWIRA